MKEYLEDVPICTKQEMLQFFGLRPLEFDAIVYADVAGQSPELADEVDLDASHRREARGVDVAAAQRRLPLRVFQPKRLGDAGVAGVAGAVPHDPPVVCGKRSERCSMEA